MRAIKSRGIGNSYLKLVIVVIVLLGLQHLLLQVKISGIEKEKSSSSNWQLTAYDFDGLERLKPKEQILLLNNESYKQK